jgi:holo-[acyl-carrier protein] synthase
MRIIGHGIDLVSVARIESMLRDHGDRFLERCFTPGERAAARDRRRAAEHLAARFAAKEAFLKALGTGLTGGISWTEIEVVTLPTGQPTLSLTGQAAHLARERGISETFLSLSHTDSTAIASVIAVES